MEEHLRWQAPPKDLQPAEREGQPAWQWSDRGLTSGDLTVTAWASASPTELTAEQWVAEHVALWTSMGRQVEPTLDGYTHHAGELTSSPRIVVATSSAAQLHVLDVRDGIGFDWTCEISTPSAVDVPLVCMVSGTTVHMSPPPLPDHTPTPDAAGVQPLRSIPREQWPCGATTDGGDVIQYTYGAVDSCSVDPVLFVPGCPERILRVWSSDGAPYKAEEDILTYSGENLVHRTSRSAPVGESSMLHRFIKPEGSSYRFGYTEGRLSEVSITAAGEEEPYKTLSVSYPQADQVVVDATGRAQVFTRLADGRLSSKTGGSSGRRMRWKADGRADGVDYLEGDEVLDRLTFVYSCSTVLEFPQVD